MISHSIDDLGNKTYFSIIEIQEEEVFLNELFFFNFFKLEKEKPVVAFKSILKITEI